LKWNKDRPPPADRGLELTPKTGGLPIKDHLSFIKIEFKKRSLHLGETWRINLYFPIYFKSFSKIFPTCNFQPSTIKYIPFTEQAG
jgi:hypothetical protein